MSNKRKMECSYLKKINFCRIGENMLEERKGNGRGREEGGLFLWSTRGDPM